MCRPHSNRGKATGQCRVAALPPGDGAISTGRQTERQRPLGQSIAKSRIVAIAGIGQHDAPCNPGSQDSLYLFQCNRGLGLELNPFWHTGSGAPRRICRPVLGQI